MPQQASGDSASIVKRLKALFDNMEAAALEKPPNVDGIMENVRVLWDGIVKGEGFKEFFFDPELVHDFKSYMREVSSCAELAKTSDTPLEKETCLRLIEDLRGGILGVMEPRECDIYGDIVMPSIKDVREYGMKLGYGFRTGEGLCLGKKVCVSAHEIRVRVMMNLLSNCFKYGKRGDVTLDYNGTVSGMHGVSVANGMEEPIPPDKLEGIFAGERLRPEITGSGIGLSSARRTVKKYGGEMWANSCVSAGSPMFRVTFTLPFAGGMQAGYPM